PIPTTLLQHLLSLYNLNSFPTRRSSDLHDLQLQMTISDDPETIDAANLPLTALVSSYSDHMQEILDKRSSQFLQEQQSTIETVRSEEHTSELQSRFDIVCRLLLDKKKKI